MDSATADIDLTGRMGKEDSPRTLSAAFKVFLTHPTPALIAAVILCLSGVRLWRGGWSGWDLSAFLLMVVLWPFIEWFLHIYVLHFKPFKVGPFTIDPLPGSG